MTGDEAWRAEGEGRSFRYSWQPDGWTQCHRIQKKTGMTTTLREACTPEEEAMAELGPPSEPLLGKTLVNFGYPIIPGLGQLPCMD